MARLALHPQVVGRGRRGARVPHGGDRGDRRLRRARAGRSATSAAARSSSALRRTGGGFVAQPPAEAGWTTATSSWRWAPRARWTGSRALFDAAERLPRPADEPAGGSARGGRGRHGGAARRAARWRAPTLERPRQGRVRRLLDQRGDAARAGPGRAAARDRRPARRARCARAWRRALERVEVAGPGFLNLFLSDDWYRTALRGRARPATPSARARRPSPRRCSSSSSRPTRPGRLTAASGRNAAYGDALARLLELRRPRGRARVLRQRLRHAGAAPGRVDPGPRPRRAGSRGRLRGRLCGRAGRADPRRRRRRSRCPGPSGRGDPPRGDPRVAARGSASTSTHGSRRRRCTKARPRRYSDLRRARGARHALSPRGRALAALDRVRRRQGPGARALDRRAHLHGLGRRLPRAEAGRAGSIA